MNTLPEPPLRPRAAWCAWYKKTTGEGGYFANVEWKARARAAGTYIDEETKILQNHGVVDGYIIRLKPQDKIKPALSLQHSEKHQMKIPSSNFGKDHWSLLAYLETCVVDRGSDNRYKSRPNPATAFAPNQAEFNPERLRCNPTNHPTKDINHIPWENTYGTRLKGFYQPDQPNNEKNRLVDHDDYDCLEDLANEGFLTIDSIAQNRYTLTSKGLATAAKLRLHKAHGGNFANFPN